MKGLKYDGDKLRYDLIPFDALEEMVTVLTIGAKKYSPENWRYVSDFESRYLAAALRHLTAHAAGEVHDAETGRPHLAHAMCCVAFLLEGGKDEGGTEKSKPQRSATKSKTVAKRTR